MKKITTLFAIGFVGSLLFFCQPAAAVTVTEYQVELFANPGNTVEPPATMQLYDDSLQGATVYVSVGNFKEDPNKPGAAILISDPAEMKPDREYVKLSATSLELPKDGGLVPFKYTIEVPINAEPGTHMLSLVFSTKPPSNSGAAVTIGTNILTNIFLKVGGATIDSIETTFDIGQYTSSDPYLENIPVRTEQAKTFKSKHFFLKPPVDFFVEVSNTGNTHQKPDGNIQIRNDLFGKAYETLDVNPENKIVLPGGTRFYPSDSFGSGFMFGKYRAKLTLIYGDPLREQTREVVFWIIPLVEISITLGSILLLIIIIVIIRRVNKKQHERKELKKERGEDKQMKATMHKEIKQSIHEANKEDGLTPSTKPVQPQTPPKSSNGTTNKT